MRALSRRQALPLLAVIVAGGVALVPAAAASAAPGLVVSTVSMSGSQAGGVEFNRYTGRLYVTDQALDVVHVYDSATMTELDTIAVGSDPTAIGIDFESNLIYVVDSSDDTVSVVDGATDAVTQVIPVGPDPHDVFVSETHDGVLVANEGDGTVSVLGPSSVLRTVSLPGVTSGAEAAVFDSIGRMYIATATDGFWAVDQNGAATQLSTAVGLSDIAVDRLQGGIFAVGPGTAGVVVRGSSTVSAPTLPLSGTAYDYVSVDSSARLLYLVSAANDDVTILDLDSKTQLGAATSLPSTPAAIAVNPSTDAAVAVSGGSPTRMYSILPSPRLIPESQITADVGQPLSYAQRVVGAGPFTFTATGLPVGVTIDSTTGVISGTPGEDGHFHPSIAVASADGTDAYASLTLIVNGPSNPSNAAPVSDDTSAPRLAATGAEVAAPLTAALAALLGGGLLLGLRRRGRRSKLEA